MLKFKNFLKQLNEQTYKEKFADLLKDMGVSSIKELSPEQKKKLFSKMDAMHVSKDEKKAMMEMVFESLTEMRGDYTEFKMGDPVEICDGEHKGKCGNIESHDDDKQTFIVNMQGKKYAFPRYSFVPFFGGQFYGGASNTSGDTTTGMDSGASAGGDGGGGAVGGESYIETFSNLLSESDKTHVIFDIDHLTESKLEGKKFDVIVAPKLFEGTNIEVQNKIRQSKKLMTESSVFVADFIKSSEICESATAAESFLKDSFAKVFVVEGTKEHPVFACMGEKLNEALEDDVTSNEIQPGQEVVVVNDKWVNNSKKGVVIGHMPVTGVFYNVRFPDGTMAIYDASSISKAETEGVQVQAGDVGSTKVEEAKEEDPCWDGYEMVGTKKKGDKEVPNCVPVKEESLEEKMTDAQKDKREEIVLAMKDKKEELMKKYGDDWEKVMYATATKQAMMENLTDDISILKVLALNSPEHESHIMILADFVEKHKMAHAKDFFEQLPDNIKNDIKVAVSPELCDAICH